MEVKSKDVFPAMFSRHAAGYKQRLDEIMARGEARGRRRVIEALDVRPAMRVLDLACGPGTLSRPLAERVAPSGEVVGIDLAPGMIELARSLEIRNARFEVMDMERLRFPDAAFDAAACGHGLQFAGDLPRALGEARRVLRRGCRFAASVPLGGRSQRPWLVLDAVVDRWLPPAPVASDQVTTRAVLDDPNAFRAELLKAGFAGARVELVEETVVWPSAAYLVARWMSWWDLASRVDALSAKRRQAFVNDAVASLESELPGPIETSGRNHVAVAIA